MSEYEFDDNNAKTVSKITDALYENLLDKFPDNDDFEEMVRIIDEEQTPILDGMIRKYIDDHLEEIADEILYRLYDLIE